MFDTQLFLGFLIDEEFAVSLKKISPQILDIFIGENDECLKEIVFQNKSYLGKFVKGICHLDELKLLESHIYSYLKKLLPDHPREVVLELLVLPAQK